MDTENLIDRIKEQRAGIIDGQVYCTCGAVVLQTNIHAFEEGAPETQCTTCKTKSIELQNGLRAMSERTVRPKRSEFESAEAFHLVRDMWLSRVRREQAAHRYALICRRCFKTESMPGTKWCEGCRRAHREMTVRSVMAKGRTCLSGAEHDYLRSAKYLDLSAELLSEVEKFLLPF